MHKKWQPAEEIPSVEFQDLGAKRKQLRLVKRQANEKLTKEVVLDGVFHELQNCLQSIGMGVDLLQLSQPDALECRTIALGIERASRLLREVQEYFFPPEIYLSTRSLEEVLLEAVRGVMQGDEKRRIRLRSSETSFSFQYDWFALGRVLERILRCAYGLLLQDGGEILVNNKARTGSNQTGIEIKVEIHGVGELEIDETRMFTPFWRANNYQAGLGLVLARQAILSREGQLTFTKTSPCRAHFTLCLEVPSEMIVHGGAGKEEDHVSVE